MKLIKLVPDNTNIDFMRFRKIAIALTMALAIAGFVLTGVRGLNLGIDFVGGQSVQADFAQPVEIEELRGKVNGLNLGDASIQQFGSDTAYRIRLPKPEGDEAAANAVVSELRAMLEAEYPGVDVGSGESVSGNVSEELAMDGTLSLVFAMIGIAAYIWIRFEWQFGVGALVTLFHDIGLLLAFFSITQLQVDLNIVAAFLTVVGYTLNDTVVIYDRIRENLRKYRKMGIVELINLSLNETLSRTITTSVALLLAIGALLLFGPEVIFGLTIAIFLGLFIGTYSSIYVSAPLLVFLGVTSDSFVHDEDSEDRQRRDDGAVV
ncbi:protein translocase subunit SecF [Sphingomicrobium astaxanthinifaciens]|uniref:protein translocase subunit SecF n=1 Tax=Sphingomicrobium astaxanthinifaciens TaxID=1227949 RepID=UPI001FCBD6F3|nr:protein translocase subunit SecF [Sphingomicrobium astaxanthinifaciens]MCJ7421495.1 protein translocase subunit SecF [Sphingomicrobium astaxanthinifaciens]